MVGCSGSSLGDSTPAAASNRRLWRCRAALRVLGVAASAVCMLLGAVDVARAATSECERWPEWQRFKQLYLSTDGRVIDASTPRELTVSEGQAYALTFALIANDPVAFERVLQWTQNNLASADLSRALPAWQWGRADDGAWRVLDENSAADADLWIAYALEQAGRLWSIARYTSLGEAVSEQILRNEVALIPGLGTTLLPGPKGFVEQQTWRLNASYLPIQVLRSIHSHARNPLWAQLLASSQRVITASAAHGAAADWIGFRPADGFIADAATHGIGSYDAIRVYLWTGMLSSADPLRKPLSHQLEPFVTLASQRQAPPETIETETLAAHGDGQVGFFAALLPLLSQGHVAAALQTYRTRVESGALQSNQHYFSDALSLFGEGWMQHRYQFERSGDLRPAWTQPCSAR
jgi:endoglucanase